MGRRILAMGAAALAATSLVAGCLGSPRPPDAAQMAVEAGRLDQVLPLLEELGVTRFTAEDGCTWIIYARGAFFDGGESCQPGGAGPFDDIAQADHARLLEAIAAAGAPTRRMLDATMRPDGRLGTALFAHSAHPFPSYWEYLYDPGNEQPKVDGGRLEVSHTRVNAGWWFVSSLDD
jgi:hypothetical protein